MNYTPAQRAVALLYGSACHLAFAAAVLSMAWFLHQGFGPATPRAYALPLDLLLLLQFPLLHSLLLTPAGARRLAALAPARIGPELRTTTFALIASLQLLLTFLLWRPLSPVLFELHGPLRHLSTALYAAGWILLALSMRDAGLGIQTGSLGWLAVFQNRPPAYPPFRERGTLRYSRHPMYLAYAVILWTGPVWTLDHLLLASLWTLYCILAPLHKESRYLRRIGPAFQSYRNRVPYFIPRIPQSK